MNNQDTQIIIDVFQKYAENAALTDSENKTLEKLRLIKKQTETQDKFRTEMNELQTQLNNLNESK